MTSLKKLVLPAPGGVQNSVKFLFPLAVGTHTAPRGRSDQRPRDQWRFLAVRGRSLSLGWLMLILAFPSYAQDVEKITIPAGTKFKASLQTPISSKLSEVGDSLQLSILENVRIDEQHLLPRGMELTGKITHVKRPGRVKGRAEVYALISELVTDYGSEPLVVSIIAADDIAGDEKIKPDEEGTLKANRDLGGDLAKAGEGASLGGIASTPIAIATHSVGPALVGPATGAALGLLLGRGKEIRLASGTVFRLKFDKDLTVPVSVTKVVSSQVGERRVPGR